MKLGRTIGALVSVLALGASVAAASTGAVNIFEGKDSTKPHGIISSLQVNQEKSHPRRLLLMYFSQCGEFDTPWFTSGPRGFHYRHTWSNGAFIDFVGRFSAHNTVLSGTIRTGGPATGGDTDATPRPLRGARPCTGTPEQGGPWPGIFADLRELRSS